MNKNFSQRQRKEVGSDAGFIKLGFSSESIGGNEKIRLAAGSKTRRRFLR